MERATLPSRNFRLSDKDMATLDALVEHEKRTTNEFFCFREPNRSDVIRFLIRSRMDELEKRARAKLEADLAHPTKQKRVRTEKATHTMKGKST